MKMFRGYHMIAAASMIGAVSAAEAQTGRLMRSPDAHPPATGKLTAAEKKANQKAAEAEKRATERNAAAAPRRSAANTGAIETANVTTERTPGADGAPAKPKPDKDGNFWPSWRYGPNGASGVFDSAAEVPKGWADHPGAFETEDEPAAAPLDL